MLSWAGVTAGRSWGTERVRLVGKRTAQGSFNIYSEAVLEWEGKRCFQLLLRLVEKVLCLV